MVAKTFLLVCVGAFLIQCTLSQCINRGPGLVYDGSGLVGPYGSGLAGLYGTGPGLAGPYGTGPGLAGPYGTGPGLAGPYGSGCNCGIASSGGGFPVTSISPLAPTGISIISENAIEGTVFVTGALPFLSTVLLEGVLPTTGTGVISYGCGNGLVEILSESPFITGIVGPAGPAYGPGLATTGPLYGPAIAPASGLGLGSVGYGCLM